MDNRANTKVREEGGAPNARAVIFSTACRNFGKDHSRTGILKMDPVAMRGLCWSSYHIGVQEGPHIGAG